MMIIRLKMTMNIERHAHMLTTTYNNKLKKDYHVRVLLNKNTLQTKSVRKSFRNLFVFISFLCFISSASFVILKSSALFLVIIKYFQGCS